MDAWRITDATALSRWPARSWPIDGRRSSCASSCSATRGSTTSPVQCPGSPARCSCSACGTSNATACSRRGPRPPGHGSEYHLTPAGRDLERVIDSLGRWAIEWLFDDMEPHQVEPTTLMWWMHRRIDPDRFPPHRTVIEWRHTAPEPETIWFVLERGAVSVCTQHPGFEVDLVVTMATADLADVFQGYRSGERQSTPGTSSSTARRNSRPRCPAGSRGVHGRTSPGRAHPLGDGTRHARSPDDESPHPFGRGLSVLRLDPRLSRDQQSLTAS